MCVCSSCLTLCSPVDCGPPGSSVHGILRTRIAERLPFLPPGDLPDPGVKPGSLASGCIARRILYHKNPLLPFPAV